MIINKFSAKKVNGYLDFDIKFNEDINFLVGHNGCGKTTALRLMTAILQPNLEELSKIEFSTCHVEFFEPIKGSSFTIRVKRYEDKISLMSSTDGQEEDFYLDDIRHGHIEESERLKEVSKLANPVLISLDRNFENLISSRKQKIRLRKDNFFYWENEEHNGNEHSKSNDKLDEVKSLITSELQKINKRKNIEDAKLKDKILLDAFRVIDYSSNGFPESINYDTEGLTEKREILISTLDTLSLQNKNLKDVKDATEKFFYELQKNIKEVQRIDDEESTAKFTNATYVSAITFIYANQAQLTRIDSLVRFIKHSQQAKSKLYEKVDLFESIVNSFFEQTGKKITIKTGKLKVNVNGKDIEVGALSSGETQIITLFAHIIFNRKLISKASFMIDEPELSLHLAWQEMFVESLQRANSNLQVILATHSPAIINGLDDKCVFVNSDK